jgi:hypothetical protein
LIVVTRRLKRTGQLVSQQILSSSDAIGGGKKLPEDAQRLNDFSWYGDIGRLEAAQGLNRRDYSHILNGPSKVADKLQGHVDNEVDQFIYEGRTPSQLPFGEAKARARAEQSQLRTAADYDYLADRVKAKAKNDGTWHAASSAPWRYARHRAQGVVARTVGRRRASSRAAREHKKS